MLRKRISEPRRLVCQFDPAFISGFDAERRDEYNATLDIDKLGDFERLDDKPAVFVCRPLDSKFEHLAYGGYFDYWEVFRQHVTDIQNCEFEIIRDNGPIANEMRDSFYPQWVQNIASMIVHLANTQVGDGFFMPSGAAQVFARSVLKRKDMLKAAEQAKEFARVAAAKINSLKSVESKQSDTTQSTG